MIKHTKFILKNIKANGKITETDENDVYVRKIICKL